MAKRNAHTVLMANKTRWVNKIERQRKVLGLEPLGLMPNGNVIESLSVMELKNMYADLEQKKDYIYGSRA